MNALANFCHRSRCCLLEVYNETGTAAGLKTGRRMKPRAATLCPTTWPKHFPGRVRVSHRPAIQGPALLLSRPCSRRWCPRWRERMPRWRWWASVTADGFRPGKPHGPPGGPPRWPFITQIFPTKKSCYGCKRPTMDDVLLDFEEKFWQRGGGGWVKVSKGAYWAEPMCCLVSNC